MALVISNKAPDTSTVYIPCIINIKLEFFRIQSTPMTSIERMYITVCESQQAPTLPSEYLKWPSLWHFVEEHYCPEYQQKMDQQSGYLLSSDAIENIPPKALKPAKQYGMELEVFAKISNYFCHSQIHHGKQANRELSKVGHSIICSRITVAKPCNINTRRENSECNYVSSSSRHQKKTCSMSST